MKRANETKKKALSTPKKLLILFLVILAIFGAVNGVWYFGYKNIYNGFAKEMTLYTDEHDDSGFLSRYGTTVDGYSFTLKMPEYLGFGGFMCISREEGYQPVYDDQGNVISDNGMLISLYIWPQIFGGYKLGLDCYGESDAEITGQFEINADLSLVNAEYMDDEAIAEVEAMFGAHSEEIQHLFDLAKEVWGLDFSE